MADRRKFIILGMQRSGTTVTHVCLNGHPHVTMPSDEVMTSPFFTRGLATFTGGKESYADRMLGYEKLFELLTSLHATDETQAIGFKTAVGNHHEALEVCTSVREYFPDVRIILVSRDDLVAQCGSLVRAEKSGEWHAWEGQKQSELDGKLTIDVERFREYASGCKQTVAQLRSLSTTHALLDFRYESHIAPGVDHASLFDFLDLPQVEVSWLRMKKVAPPARDFIANYDALATELEAMASPGEAEELKAGRAHRTAIARREQPNFLMTRATHALETGGARESAIADVRVALEGGAPDVWLLAKAYGLLERGGSADCADVLETLIEDNQDNPYFLVPRAHERFLAGDFDASLADSMLALEHAEKLDARTRANAFVQLERILVRREDPALARETIAKLAQQHDGDSGYHFLRGFVERALGDTDAAMTSLRRSLEIEEDHTRARELLAQLEEAAS